MAYDEGLATRIREFRAVATRFLDRLAVPDQATLAVADIFVWLRAKPDQPRASPSRHAVR